jgi:glycosyltransferase involved in cell wall biosynthesis
MKLDTKSNLADLAALLDSRVLLDFIAGRKASRAEVLNQLSQRLTARGLFEIVIGRRGSRWGYLKQMRRRFYQQKSKADQELFDLLSIDEAGLSGATRLVPGIAHYGLFHAEIGVGQGARRLAGAIKHAGIPLSAHNISLPRHESKVDFEANDDLISCYDTILLHFNANTFLDLIDFFPLAALFPRRRVAHWVWELPVLPMQWKPALDKVHEVWAPSRFVAEAVANATKKPVRVVPYPVPLQDYPRHEARKNLKLPDDAFIFLTIFDSSSFLTRKNVIGAVRAFTDAFPNHGVSSPILVIKCHGVSNRGADFKNLSKLAAESRRVILIDRVFSEAEMTQLQAACDCLISLHRAEGFGFNIAECMSKGKIVIATNFSGNTDFTRPENSLLVPYKMAAVRKNEYIYGGGQWWAEPDHEAAVETIRLAASNTTDIQRLAARARADIAKEYSVEAIGSIVKAAWEEKLERFTG